MPCPSACECFRRRAWSAVGALPSRKNARIHQNWPKYHFYPFYTLKPHPTMTQRIAANPRAVGRVTPCAPLLTFKPASYPSCQFPNAFLLRNKLSKCLFLQQVTPAASASNSSDRVAPGFPLPSTGRGIEGEGWSYPAPPPVRFFRYQPHPASRLNPEHFAKNPRNITLYALKTPAHNHQTNGRISLGGRARHSVYAAIGINPNRLSHAAASQTLAERLTRKARKKPRNNTFILLSF